MLFGASIVGSPEVHDQLGRTVLAALNRRGVFANLDDTGAGLHDLLHHAFGHVDLAPVGAAAIFAARQPTTESSTADPGLPTSLPPTARVPTA